MITMTVKSVKVVEAKSSSNIFLDPKPYIRRPKPHLQQNTTSIIYALQSTILTEDALEMSI